MVKTLGNLLKLIVASIGIIRKPERLDGVIEAADRLRVPVVMEPILTVLNQDPVTRQALSDRRRLPPLDLDMLESLPAGSLGRALFNYFSANQLDPASGGGCRTWEQKSSSNSPKKPSPIDRLGRVYARP